MEPKPSKRYLLYAIELHESAVRNIDVPSVQEQHLRAIVRLKLILKEEYPEDDQTDREDDRGGQNG